MIGFIDTLCTPLGTTGNYSAISDLHTLQFTVTHVLGFPVFTSRILVTNLSYMKSSCHSLIPFLPFLLSHLRLSSPELCPFLDNCFVIQPRSRPRGKHRLLFPRIVLDVFTDPLPSNRHPIVARVGSRRNVLTESLPSNGSIHHNILCLRVYICNERLF
jgi:hypothetical protein